MADAPTLLPPFPALRAFHAAARHDRFRDAAAELGVTESAVSHQIRRLEEFLHVSLFERRGRQVTLTDRGQRYFDEIDPAMVRIREATRALIGPAERDRVALTLPPSLAILWLIPNLAAFERACPGIDLQLVTTTRVCDLRREQIDLAIRYGRGPWSEVESAFLLAETALPVCKPGYIDIDDEPGADIEGVLVACRLIISGYHPDEWYEWARAHGLDSIALDGALRLESQKQVLEAAEHGLGIGIGRRPLVDERLKSGALVAPFGTLALSKTGYHLCQATAVPPSAATRRVARWLRAFAESQAQVNG